MLFSHFMTNQQPKTDKQAVSVFNQKDPNKVTAVKSKADKDVTSIGGYEKYYSEHIKKILEQVTGVGKVSVMVTLESSEKKIYQENQKTQNNSTEETDKSGGKRAVNETSVDSQVVIIGDGTNKGPVVIGQQKPEIKGVAVVAEGADNPTIRSWIMEAVSTVLDIPNYKVEVLPKN